MITDFFYTQIADISSLSELVYMVRFTYEGKNSVILVNVSHHLAEDIPPLILKKHLKKATQAWAEDGYPLIT